MTLLEKAKALGITIKKTKVDGYPIYRVNCSTCYQPGERPRLPRGTNYSADEIRKEMNDHARWHIAKAKVKAQDKR